MPQGILSRGLSIQVPYFNFPLQPSYATAPLYTLYALELANTESMVMLIDVVMEVAVNNMDGRENLWDHELASISFKVADDLVSKDVMRAR